MKLHNHSSAFILIVSIALGSASASPRPARSKRPAPIDRDYLAALATADRFLQAWQARDHETGVMMLSDSAKEGLPEERLVKFLSPDAASQRAFEIAPGRRLKSGRYLFSVVLLETEETPSGTVKRTRSSRLAVGRIGGDWVVDKLP